MHDLHLAAAGCLCVGPAALSACFARCTSRQNFLAAMHSRPVRVFTKACEEWQVCF